MAMTPRHVRKYVARIHILTCVRFCTPAREYMGAYAQIHSLTHTHTHTQAQMHTDAPNMYTQILTDTHT